MPVTIGEVEVVSEAPQGSEPAPADQAASREGERATSDIERLLAEQHQRAERVRAY